MPYLPPSDEYKISEPRVKRRKINHPETMARPTPSNYHAQQEQQLSHSERDTDEYETSHVGEAGSSQSVFRTSSREELMACIKRGKKATWVPPPSFQALCEQENGSNREPAGYSSSTEVAKEVSLEEHEQKVDQLHLASPDRHTESNSSQSTSADPHQRPRSALHRGDFAEPSFSSDLEDCFVDDTFQQPGLAISTNIVSGTPRFTQDLTEYPTSSSIEAAPLHQRSLGQLNTSSVYPRQRAPSLGSSLSSSFVFRTPTSPLVHALTHSNHDLSDNYALFDHRQPRSARDTTRRRTMPPSSFPSSSSIMSPLEPTTPNFSRPFSFSLRRESSMPTYTHHARRSLSSSVQHLTSDPHSPLMRTRRPTMTSENTTTARRRTSMVGSFEESILRGAMSTPPSKPLDFLAQIGVMGRGECPSSLKCPPHVTVPFPAVFYNYPAMTGPRSIADDTPSPYVGTIDLEHNLKPIILATKQARRSDHKDHDTTAQHMDVGDTGATSRAETSIRLGGAYRVPRQGQLQIIIKNPNKTAVKLFLVPYDLEDMPSGTKTFVRQKSYSTGPIVEEAVCRGSPPVASVDPLENKHILRYLIHVKFCCPSRNKYYLYDDIRVVFANRVPDGKEKLRNEIHTPEPKYAIYKVDRPVIKARTVRSTPGTPTSPVLSEFGSPESWIRADDRSNAYSPEPSPLRSRTRQPPLQSLGLHKSSAAAAESGLQHQSASSTHTIPSPFQFPDIKSEPIDFSRQEQPLTPVKGFHATTSPRAEPPLSRHSPSAEVRAGRSFSPTPESSVGLLSQQLHQLDSRKAKERQVMRDMMKNEQFEDAQKASP